jgi:DNA-binding NarL/FixJ family response regulator
MADNLQLAIEPRTPGGRGNEMSWGLVTPSHPGTAHDHTALAQAMTQARITLAEAGKAAASAAQQARTVAAALDEMLAVLAAPERAPIKAPRPADNHHLSTGALSPREREVLALVAEGRSNKAIAEALFVSPNTVKTHVASLLTKLRADTRAQLAAIAVRQLEPTWQKR